MDCARKLTQTLVNYHHSQIVNQEQLAESVITNASHIIIPEHITNVPDIPVKIESAIQGLLCESSLLSRTIRKRSSKNKITPDAKRTKPPSSSSSQSTTTTTTTTTNNSPTPSTSERPSSSNNDTMRKYPWRLLKLKKKKK